MTLLITDISKFPPVAPYGDATRLRPLVFTIEQPDLTTQEIIIHESQLDEFLDQVLARFRSITNVPDLTAASVVAVMWGLWKHRIRSANLNDVLNVDIEQ